MPDVAAETLVAADRVSVVFDGRLRALDDVSLEVRRGETLGLVGESGSGKTTLAKTMVALQRPTSGSVRLAGRDLATLTGRDLLAFRRRAQMLFQDPVASLSPRLSIRSLLTEPIRIHSLPFQESWARLGQLMERIGLAEGLFEKFPHQVSGGQARRVAIARALLLQPDLIVADEPTAGLDVSIQGGLLNLLGQLQREFGLTFLIVSHNLNVIRRVTDRVAVMYLGQVVELAATKHLFVAPAHPYSAALLSANPIVDPAKRRAKIVLTGEIPSPLHPPPGCRFHTRCPQAQARCAAEPPELRPLDGGLVRCHFPLVAGEQCHGSRVSSLKG